MSGQSYSTQKLAGMWWLCLGKVIFFEGGICTHQHSSTPFIRHTGAEYLSNVLLIKTLIYELEFTMAKFVGTNYKVV